jgi:hypothetical protein
MAVEALADGGRILAERAAGHLSKSCLKRFRPWLAHYAALEQIPPKVEGFGGARDRIPVFRLITRQLKISITFIASGSKSARSDRDLYLLRVLIWRASFRRSGPASPVARWAIVSRFHGLHQILSPL